MFIEHLPPPTRNMAEEVSSPTSSIPPTGVTGSKATNGSTSIPSPYLSNPHVRNRLLGRSTVNNDGQNPRLDSRRRSSILSASSMEDARNSIRSSTDDLLLPRSSSPTNHEPSLWHSSPLIFALLPAVGGMVFQNGSAVVTDITLLALAAVFLNWSIRLPWDWYNSAQSVATAEPYLPDTISEESEGDDESADEDGAVPGETLLEGSRTLKKTPPTPRSSPRQLAANKELRLHEVLALFSCFLFPILGAYLLHSIRRQLSRPSEGLVSDYNLTIFILASEIRPLAHLIKMIQSRTLFLQRRVNQNPYLTPSPGLSSTGSELSDLTKRLANLEAHSNAAASPAAKAAGVTPTALTMEVRRTLQPDLDALNRAVRRYEKRATMQTMQTESRLVDLEIRLNDALSLAAAAAASGQRSRHGFAAILVDWICAGVVLPMQAMLALAGLPMKAGLSIVSSIGGMAGVAGGRSTSKGERKSTGTRERGYGRERDRERMGNRAVKKV